MFNLDNYEPVEERLAKYWADHKEDGRIETILVDIVRDAEGRPKQYVVEARVWAGDRVLASGFAEELVGGSPVNRTSALENAETSAIGRALANANYAKKGARPSREEMDKATRLKGTPDDDPFYTSGGQPSGEKVQDVRRASSKQLWLIAKRLEEKGVTDKGEQLAVINLILSNDHLGTIEKGPLLKAAHVDVVLAGIDKMQTVDEFVAEQASG